MSREEESIGQHVETEETVVAPEPEDADESMRQLITLAIIGAAGIAFLAICLPMFIL